MWQIHNNQFFNVPQFTLCVAQTLSLLDCYSVHSFSGFVSTKAYKLQAYCRLIEWHNLKSCVVVLLTAALFYFAHLCL